LGVPSSLAGHQLQRTALSGTVGETSTTSARLPIPPALSWLIVNAGAV
jgi:hypothetical protein